MDMDFALRAGQFAFTALVGLYSLLASRRSSSKAEAEQLATRLTNQDNRILVLEQSMKHLPDSEQLAELADELGELAGAQREVHIHQVDSLSCSFSSAFSCARLVRAQAP